MLPALLLVSVLLATGAPAAVSRPIRTNEPGTGIFIGSGLLGQFQINRESDHNETLTETIALFDYRYTLSTHWVLGIRAPFILDKTLKHSGLGDQQTAGIGDFELSVKHRFFRSVGQWSDRHAALEVIWKLPTGSTTQFVDPALPIHRKRRLQPGTGSHDFTVDLIYQEGRGRLVYGGNLSYTLTTEDEHAYRFGDEARLNLDFEYIFLPRVYRRPGKEVFLLLEAVLIHKRADRFQDQAISATRRTELLLAPGVQYIATERLLFSFSFQFPLYENVIEGGLQRDFDLLAEFRYAF